MLCAVPVIPLPASPTSRLLSRLSEQTLLVEKLTEQNLKKDSVIASLKVDVQRLVRGLGGGWLCPGAAAASLRGLPWSQEAGRSRGQPAGDSLKDEVASLQRVLDAITEVRAPWVPVAQQRAGCRSRWAMP